MKHAFELIDSGLQTLVTTTPLDITAAHCANSFVGNAPTAAVIEVTLMGPKMRFIDACVIAICGAELSPTLNGSAIENNKAYAVKMDDVLSFGKNRDGLRAYIACGDEMRNGSIYQLPKTILLKAAPAPEFAQLPAATVAALFSYKFTVSKLANRMGAQLEQRLENDLAPIITSPVMPGTLQLTADGRLIVLLADCQITGGYPRILQLSSGALNVIAQLGPGAALQFCR
jgi:allophanate hydrolase subunit 2